MALIKNSAAASFITASRAYPVGEPSRGHRAERRAQESRRHREAEPIVVDFEMVLDRRNRSVDDGAVARLSPPGPCVRNSASPKRVGRPSEAAWYSAPRQWARVAVMSWVLPGLAGLEHTGNPVGSARICTLAPWVLCLPEYHR